MTVQEAYKTFKNTEPKLEVMSCHEFDTRFVFHAVPSKFATPDQAAKILDSLFSVDKKTGKISTFTPLDIPTDEYKRGKHIPIYDHK